MVTHTTILRAIISFGLFAAPTVAAPAAVADPVALAAPAPLAEPATAAAAAGEYLGVNSPMLAILVRQTLTSYVDDLGH